jgi:hypothetical protein
MHINKLGNQMAITVTVEDVRAVVPELQATDAAIQMHINIVICKVGDCLEANYTDCPEIQEAIVIYTVAYFADKGNDNKGAITSQKWADGDMQGFSDSQSSSSAYWDTMLQLDSAGCVSNAFRSGKVFAVTGKTSKYFKDAV